MGAKDNDLKDFKLRPMNCELNFLSNSDGSAILSQGNTVALVSVNGPLDIKTQSQNIKKCALDVLFCSKSGKPSVQDRFKENVIKQTIETAVLSSLYPRTGLTITIQELEDDGGFIACALNCACLALLSAGVSLRHVFACASSAPAARAGLRLDAPGARDAPELTAVFRSDDNSLVTCTTEGSFTEDTYKEAVERCRAASQLVFAFYRDAVAKYSAVV